MFEALNINISIIHNALVVLFMIVINLQNLIYVVGCNSQSNANSIDCNYRCIYQCQLHASIYKSSTNRGRNFWVKLYIFRGLLWEGCNGWWEVSHHKVKTIGEVKKEDFETYILGGDVGNRDGVLEFEINDNLKSIF